MIRHLLNLARHSLRNLGGKARSPEWEGVRKAHLKEEPECRACGSARKLQVHHMKPFHLDPSLELDDKNLITLCMSPGRDCHLYIGHGDNFKAFNPNVQKDVNTAYALVMAKDEAGLKALWARIKKNRKFEIEG